MPIIKQTIKFNNLDVSIPITIGSNIGLTDYQQEIDNLTTDVENTLINPVVDYEERKFNYYNVSNPTLPLTINFYFYSGGTTKPLSFLNTGFLQTEINTNNVNLLNSFFIMDFYDSYNPYTQTKIFTTYLTKILGSNNNTPVYNIASGIVNQLYYWYIPQWYIDNMLLSGNTATGYTKFSFYNAKTGNIQLFYNQDNINLGTLEKIYFKSILNLTDMTWNISTTSSPNINAYELNNSSQYSQRVNNTVNNFNDLQQNYPTGNTFQSSTGSYIND